MIKSTLQLGKIGLSVAARSAMSRSLGKKYLIDQIAKIPGLPAKAGQMLSMRLGEESTVQVEPQRLDWVRDRLKEKHNEFYRDTIEIEPAFAVASLGQVHRVRLKDGRRLVFKLRYPDVAENLQDQLDLLLVLLGKFSKSKRYGLDTVDYENFLRSSFAEELDYQIEAKNQIHCAQLFGSDKDIIIPKVELKYSDSELLVQSEEESFGLNEILSWTKDLRHQVVQNLARFFISGLFDFGFVHADLHTRNWGARKSDGSIIVYDFGSVLRLDSNLRECFRRLSFDLPQLSDAQIFELLLDLGFDEEKLGHIQDQIRAVVALLFEPMWNQNWKLREWNISERLESLLGPNRWWLRTAGPAWFMLMMRTSASLVSALSRLDGGLDMALLLSQYSRSIGRELESKSLQNHLDEVKTALADGPRLRVRIEEHSAPLVELEFPARSVEHLEELISDDILQRIREDKIDIYELKNKAIASGFARQNLFQIEKAPRSYRVWID